MGYHTRVVTATHIYYDIYHRDWVHPKCQWILGSGLLIIEVNVNQSWINFTKPLPTTAIVIVHRLCLTFSACIVIYVKGLLQHCRSMKYMICSKCPANEPLVLCRARHSPGFDFPKICLGNSMRFVRKTWKGCFHTLTQPQITAVTISCTNGVGMGPLL